MEVLGFRKRRSDIGADPHFHYDHMQFGYSLKPERERASDHGSYTRGLRHFCFRVAGEGAMDHAARALWEAGVEATELRY
jgi:hypothetical protein